MLYRLQASWKTPSPRRTRHNEPEEAMDQLVLNTMTDEQDHDKRRGTQQTMDILAQELTPVPRYVSIGFLLGFLFTDVCYSAVIRTVKRLNEPEAVDARYPGRRKTGGHPGRLTAVGPLYEVNSDGHEKLNSQALRMGPVSLPIYGKKDKFSSAWLMLLVVPDSRDKVTIAHFQLDFISQFGCTYS